MLLSKKKIKKSKRGLTFSFNSLESCFKVGKHYSYIVDRVNRKVIIEPSTSPKDNVVSRKKTKTSVKSLFDLRNQDTLNAFDDATHLEVQIFHNKIIVQAYEERQNADELVNTEKDIAYTDITDKVINLSEQSKFRQISEVVLSTREVKKVSGLHNGLNYAAFTSLDTSNETGVSNKVKKELDLVLTVNSLCCGAGMFDYPFKEHGGYDISFALDFNDDAVRSYSHNIGDHVLQGDLRTFDLNSLPKSDILIAGPPCTPYSNENRNSENRLDKHKDAGLIDKCIEHLCKRDYKAFLIENVSAILSKGNIIDKIKKLLPSYKLSFGILNDAEQGGYTNRNRAFIIGSNVGKVPFPKPIITDKSKFKTVQEALFIVNERWANYQDVTKHLPDVIERMKHVPQGGNYKDIPSELLTSTRSRHSNCYRRLDNRSISPTIVNFRKPPLIHPLENRTLTVAEASALSGFKKNFSFFGSLSSKQQQVGNGVPYSLGKTLASAIYDYLFKVLKKEKKILSFGY